MRRTICIASFLLVASLSIGFAAGGSAFALEPEEPAADEATRAAEAWFRGLHGFNGLEAYEAVHGASRASFMIARRWDGGTARVLFDVLSPPEFARWALLLIQQLERGDDFFLYLPGRIHGVGRKVVRLSPGQIEAEVPFKMLPLGEFRPISAGELAYRVVGERSVDGHACTVIEGVPRHPGLSFDRVELTIAKESGVALESHYFRGKRLSRRMRISPEDLREHGDRTLPRRRFLHVPPGDGETELFLRNVIVDSTLPSQLFTKHGLRKQRFPRF